MTEPDLPSWQYHEEISLLRKLNGLEPRGWRDNLPFFEMWEHPDVVRARERGLFPYLSWRVEVAA